MTARLFTMLALATFGLGAILAGGIAASTPATAAGASAYKAKAKTYRAWRHRAAKRRRPQVRGFIARRGGYSFDASDTVNTTVGTRSLYGSANVFRDRQLDTQTVGGPFDHGFFFNSPVGPRGGDSPYYQ